MSHGSRVDIINSSNRIVEKQSSKFKDLSSRLEFYKSITSKIISNSLKHALDESDSLIDPDLGLNSKQIQLNDKNLGTGKKNNDTELIIFDFNMITQDTIIISDDLTIDIIPEKIIH